MDPLTSAISPPAGSHHHIDHHPRDKPQQQHQHQHHIPAEDQELQMLHKSMVYNIHPNKQHITPLNREQFYPTVTHYTKQQEQQQQMSQTTLDVAPESVDLTGPPKTPFWHGLLPKMCCGNRDEGVDPKDGSKNHEVSTFDDITANNTNTNNNNHHNPHYTPKGFILPTNPNDIKDTTNCTNLDYQNDSATTTATTNTAQQPHLRPYPLTNHNTAESRTSLNIYDLHPDGFLNGVVVGSTAGGGGGEEEEGEGEKDEQQHYGNNPFDNNNLAATTTSPHNTQRMTRPATRDLITSGTGEGGANQDIHPHPHHHVPQSDSIYSTAHCGPDHTPSSTQTTDLP